jgi:triphosphatase
MAQETELKLAVDPADVERFAAALGRAPEQTLIFATRYFDTPDGTLAKAGISLRIRSESGNSIQTVKQSKNENAGLLSRGEWERPVYSDGPALDGDDPASALLAGDASALEERFTLAITRQLWRIAHEGSAIELVLDQGSITAGAVQAPVCEIEAELISGEVIALFSFARQLSKQVPLHLGLWSKAQAGERLRAGLAASPAKGGKFVLTPKLSPQEALAEALSAGVRHFRLNEDVLLTGHDATAIHQARVAIRRLRAALALFRPLLKPSARRGLNDRLRALGQALGPVRERDVLIAELPANVRRAARKARDEAYASARRRLDSRDVRRLPLELLALAHDPNALRGAVAGQPVGACVATGLDRIETLLRKESGSLADMAAEQRHSLRKRVKALRYALDMAGASSAAGGAKRDRRRALDLLAVVQESLGTLNDVHERPALLAQLGLPPQSVPPLDETALLTQAQAALDECLLMLPLWDASRTE